MAFFAPFLHPIPELLTGLPYPLALLLASLSSLGGVPAEVVVGSSVGLLRPDH